MRKRGVIIYLCFAAVDNSSIVEILGFVHGTDQLNLLMLLRAKAELHLADLWALLTMRAIFFPVVY